jgi:hypothetical protein
MTIIRSPRSPEIRKAPRKQYLQPATIESPEDGPRYSCMVTHISKEGVCIALSEASCAQVPDHFVLSFAAEKYGRKQCRVERRSGFTIIAQFASVADAVFLDC